MSGPDGQTADREGAALRTGRSEGMATAALALGAVAFLNLLGAEKGILAIVLAVLSLSPIRRMSHVEGNGAA